MSRLRALSLFGFVALALPLVGCVGGGGGDDEVFFLDWGIQYLPPADNPNAQEFIGCQDAGAAKVALKMTNTRSNTVYDQTFSCGAGVGQSQILPLGPYEVQISLLTETDQVISAVLLETSIVRNQTTDLGTVLFAIQSFRMIWTVQRGDAGITCAAAGATSVRLNTQPGSSAPTRYLFPCDDHEGVTTAVQPGIYSVWVELLDSANAVLSATPAMTFEARADRRAVLPGITFSVAVP